MFAADPLFGQNNAITQLLAAYDVLALAGRFTPSFVAASGAVLPPLMNSATIELPDTGSSYWLLLLLVLAGLITGTWFFVTLGRAVRGEPSPIAVGAGEYGRALLRYCGLLLLGVVGVFGVALLISISAQFGGGAASLVITLAAAGCTWLLILLYFCIDAIAVSALPVRKALRASVAVVRFDFGAAAWIIVLASVIRFGFPFIWTQLSGTIPGLIGVCLVNAYIGVGLAAATMLFFLRQWEHINRLTAPPALASRVEMVNQ
jgi:hypothetical protein